MKKVGFIVDLISSLNVMKDTTFYMAEVAKQRGWDVYFIEYHQLVGVSRAASVELTCNAVRISDFKASCEHIFKTHVDLSQVLLLDEAIEVAMIDFDMIFMRKDPPFTTNYIYLTYFLDLLKSQGVAIVNNPQGLRDYNEKFSIMRFPECVPKTVIASSAVAVKEFIEAYGSAVVKPLDNMGGRGIMILDDQDAYQDQFEMIVVLAQSGYFMIQEKVDIFSGGDKRVFIIDGQVIPYACARFPAAGSLIANLAQGGSYQVVELDSRDFDIAESVAESVVNDGMRVIGLDIVDGYLTEINVTSPTCMREINERYPIDLSCLF